MESIDPSCKLYFVFTDSIGTKCSSIWLSSQQQPPPWHGHDTSCPSWGPQMIPKWFQLYTIMRPDHLCLWYGTLFTFYRLNSCSWSYIILWIILNWRQHPYLKLTPIKVPYHKSFFVNIEFFSYVMLRFHMSMKVYTSCFFFQGEMCLCVMSMCERLFLCLLWMQSQ